MTEITQFGNVVSVESLSKMMPSDCKLDGTFEECLNYLNWSINVYAGKGNMSVEKKAQAFKDAINTLYEKYGMKISTHYLKQFCGDRKHKNLHIAYMLKISGLETRPTRVKFRGAIVNGKRMGVPKIFDFIVPKND